MYPPQGIDTLPPAVDDASSLALALDAPSTVLDMATSVIASAAAAAATATGSSSPQSEDGSPPGECSLLGPFALLVQGALGALALLSLVYKRWRERPQRPLKIWFFDVSKQVFGSVLVHIANIFMSMLTSGRFSVQVEPVTTKLAARSDDDYAPNPCSFYLLNLAIDVSSSSLACRLCIEKDSLTLRTRPPSESQSSSSFSASSPVSPASPPLANHPSPYNQGTMAARPMPGGG